MEYISMADVREAERLSKVQRINNARYLKFDETKCASARDVMLLHRVRAAAVERSDAFDVMLSDLDVNRLFNDGAISIERVV
jgi:hypothetical protein